MYYKCKLFTSSKSTLQNCVYAKVPFVHCTFLSGQGQGWRYLKLTSLSTYLSADSLLAKK